MSKVLSEEEIKYIAKLSRLKLNENEVKEFTNQLNSILDYMKKLNEVDTEGIEPTSHAFKIVNVFRDDVVKDSRPIEDMLKNAPERHNEFYKVPKIIE